MSFLTAFTWNSKNLYTAFVYLGLSALCPGGPEGAAESLYLRIVLVIENKRNFIRTEKFIGPDRRREDGYAGLNRRGGNEGELRFTTFKTCSVVKTCCRLWCSFSECCWYF